MSVVQDLPARGAPIRNANQRLRSFSGRHRSTTIVAGMALVGLLLPIIAGFPPFTAFQSQVAWVDGFSNAGVFVLLAIGLNIVVGVAGLLDLGYAAFFAIGSYAYAYAASPYGNQILGINLAATFGDASRGRVLADARSSAPPSRRPSACSSARRRCGSAATTSRS